VGGLNCLDAAQPMARPRHWRLSHGERAFKTRSSAIRLKAPEPWGKT
jgi:hypothetical protein